MMESQGIGMTSQRTRDRLVQRLRSEGIENPAVLEAIGTTPRHLFVDEALASRAYEDTALPIGLGQTISQPTSCRRRHGLIGTAIPKASLRRYPLEVETPILPIESSFVRSRPASLFERLSRHVEEPLLHLGALHGLAIHIAHRGL